MSSNDNGPGASLQRPRNHRLGTLALWHGINATGRAHRALADAEMAAELWQRIVRDVQHRYAATVPFGLLCALQRTPRPAMSRCVQRYFASPPAALDVRDDALA